MAVAHPWLMPMLTMMPILEVEAVVVPMPTPIMMLTLEVGAVEAPPYLSLVPTTTTTPTSHTPILPTDAPMPIRLQLRSRRLTIECARRETAKGTPALLSPTSNGQHAARSATRKAPPRTRHLATRRRVLVPHEGANADVILTPSLAGIPSVDIFAVTTASTLLARSIQRPAITHSDPGITSNRRPRVPTLLHSLQ